MTTIAATSIALPILDREPFSARFETELRRLTLTTLQINIGRMCNLACNHCHVESSPARTDPEDNMSEETARRIVDWAHRQDQFRVVDFTGGSPEMNSNFRWMVEAFDDAGWEIKSRCNPTIIMYKGRKRSEDYSWVPRFYADHHVEVIASLPCYLEENVNRQRGRRAFVDSIRGLLKLNEVGYGHSTELRLNLVYNPVGPSLPPPQCALEMDYRKHLYRNFGLVFNELWVMTNMPIKRWRHELERNRKLEPYMLKLMNAFNPATIGKVMCRHQVNIGPDGRMYDCDFNQALDIPSTGFEDRYIWEIDDAAELADQVINTADHCFGCTAGAGSSCGGALT